MCNLQTFTNIFRLASRNRLQALLVSLAVVMSRGSRFFDNDMPDFPQSGTSQFVCELGPAPDIASHLRYYELFTIEIILYPENFIALNLLLKLGMWP